MKMAVVANAPLAHVLRSGVTPTSEHFSTIDLRRCSACGHAWNSSAETVFSHEPSFLTNEPVSQSMDTRIRDLARYLTDSLAHTPSRVLEVGAGSGLLSIALADKGHEVCALEPSTRLDTSRLTACGVRVVRDFWPSSALELEKFDLVVCVQVLEHSMSPGHFLTAIAGALTIDGRAYVEVPSGDWVWRHQSPIDVHAPHINYFSEASLHGLVVEAGLRVIGRQDLDAGRNIGLLLRRTDSNDLLVNSLNTNSSWRRHDYETFAESDCLALASAVSALRERVQSLRGSTALYGANAGSQSLLGWIPTTHWDCIFDDTPEYWGHSAYSAQGTFPILNPESVDLNDRSVIVIAAYVHDVVIAERLRNLGFRGEILTLRPPSAVTVGPPSLLT